MPRLPMVVPILCVLLLLASCRGKGSGASASASAAGGLDAILATIPDTPETRSALYLIDWTLLERERAVTPLAYPSDSNARLQFMLNLFPLNNGRPNLPMGLPPFMSGLDPGSSARSDGLQRYFGFRRIDQTALAGTPPRVYQVVRGAFDTKKADSAIAACTDNRGQPCPPPARLRASGVSFYSWGEDFLQNGPAPLAPPAYDQLRRGGRIAVTDQFILRAEWTDGEKQLLAAYSGGPSLAKNQDYVLAVKSIEHLGAHQAFLTDRTQGPEQAAAVITSPPKSSQVDARRFREAWTPALGEPVLEPYSLLVVGTILDSGGLPYTCLVLVQRSEQEAKQNADLLKQRIGTVSSAISGISWSSIIPTVETTVVGRVLEVRLPGSNPALSFLNGRDPLLLHR